MQALPDPVADQLASGPDDDAPRRGPAGKVWAVLGTLAVLVVGVLQGPELLASSRTPRPQPTPADSPAAVTTPTGAVKPYRRPPALDWKTRGDLARDQKFVKDVFEHVRRDRPSAAVMLFAATLPDGGRLGLVGVDNANEQDRVDGGLEVRSVHLRPGQSVEDAHPEFAGELAEDDALVGWAGRSRDDRVYAAVLGPPRPIEGEISAFVQYEPTGHARRTWSPFSGRNGYAVLDLGTRSDHVVAVRPLSVRGRWFPLVIPVDRAAEAIKRSNLAFGPEDLRGLRSDRYAGPPAVSVVFAVSEVTQSIFDAAAADLRVIWSGGIDEERRGTLVRARLPDGPAFHVFVVVDEGSGAYSASVRRVPWAEADVTPWLFVQPEADKPVLLVNPSRRGVAVIEYDGQPTRRVTIGRRGLAQLARDQFTAYNIYGATVTVLAPDGRRVVRSTLTHLGDDDIFVLK